MRGFGPTLAIAVAVLATWQPQCSGQEPKKSTSDPGAFKLPDGTIIFYTSPDSKLTPTPDSVRLSAKEYAALLERAARAEREARNVSPSECHIVASIDGKNERSVATLSFHYRFKTTVTRTSVALGGRGTFPVSAKFDSGEVPLLRATEDGYTVVVEKPGENGLTLVSDVSVSVRQGRSEIGFETTLPGSVVSSFAIKKSASIPETVSLSTRTASGLVESKRIESGKLEATSERPNGLPLGAATTLELSWDNPTGTPIGISSAEYDLAIRVDDTFIESISRIHLKGSIRNWTILLPAQSTIVVERIVGKQAPTADPRVTVVAPKETNGTEWHMTVPEAGEWLVTATHRRSRPAKTAPEYFGPYPVGMISVPEAMRQFGKVQLFAPSHVRIVPAHDREIHEIDPPLIPPGEDIPDAVFSFRSVPVILPNRTVPPLMTFDIRPAPAIVQLKPNHRLRLIESGWQLRSELSIVPKHVDLNQLIVDVPSTWGAVEFGPAELVEGVQVISDTAPTRRLAVRFTSIRKEPFNLVLDTTIPITSGLRTTTLDIRFPQFPNSLVRDSKTVATVPDGWTVKGYVNEGEAGAAVRQSEMTIEAGSGKSSGPITSLSAMCDRATLGVQLTWQPYRPELSATVMADVVVNDRQIVISETMTFSAQSPYPRPLRFRGPSSASGMRATPPLTPISSGEYSLTPPTDKNSFRLTVSYAVPNTGKTSETDLSIPLLWPEEATQTTTTVRTWIPAGKSIAGFQGPWKEEAPILSPERDSWPVAMISSTRYANDPAPNLSLRLVETGDASTSDTNVERIIVSAGIGEDGYKRIRGRYWFSRWPTSGIEWEIPEDATAEFWLEGKRVEGTPLPPQDGTDTRRIRISLPESRANRPQAVLDVRLMFRTVRTDSNNFRLPTIRRAQIRSVPYWSISSPPNRVLLDLRRELSYGMVWRWQGFPLGFGLVPNDQTDDALLRGADESESDFGTVKPIVSGHADQFDNLIRVTTIPRLFWILVCSGFVLLLGTLIFRRLPIHRGPLVAISACVLALALMILPQATGQALVAAQPGFAIGLTLLGIGFVSRSWRNRRRQSLNAFERLGVDSAPRSDLQSERPSGRRPQVTPLPVPLEPR